MFFLLGDSNSYTTQDLHGTLKNAIFLGCFAIAVLVGIIWWLRRG